MKKPTREEKNTHFINAIKMNYIESVKALLKDGDIHPEDNNSESICIAALLGHADIVSLLIADKRVDPSTRANAPLWIAAKNGYKDVVALLLGCSTVNPADVNNMAIWWAVIEGHSEIVKLLLTDPRVDPSVDDNALVFTAAKSENTTILKLLLADPRIILSNKTLCKLANRDCFSKPARTCFLNKLELSSNYKPVFFEHNSQIAARIWGVHDSNPMNTHLAKL